MRLFATCERCDWLLHAFVVMGNHYHLAVETPKSNLVTGMQWLQSTFAVAAHLKATTDVTNVWLAEQLDMGSHFYVSKHVGKLRNSVPVKPANGLKS